MNCQHEEQTKERDNHVLDVMCAILEASYECMPLSSKVKSSGIKREKLPGWKENVATAKDDALFWHATWLSAGRPLSGGLYQIMPWSRNQFHYAVRRAKREAAAIRSRKLLEAAEHGNIALLKEMKNTLERKNCGQAVPETLDGKVTHDSILDRFRECYEELYNSAGTEHAMNIIKQKLHTLIQENSQQSVNEVKKVTGKLVKEACCRMLQGKTDVTGVYSSDVFLHAPDLLFDQLAEVFQSYPYHGTVSLQILSCAFLPLFKGGLKNPAIFDSYRAIAGAS